MISRLAGASCRSILYCSPEQPPPTTATRRTPLARPCLVSKELTFLAALGVTLIRRSSPTRKPGVADVLLPLAAIIARLTTYPLDREGSTVVAAYGLTSSVLRVAWLLFLAAPRPSGSRRNRR